MAQAGQQAGQGGGGGLVSGFLSKGPALLAGVAGIATAAGAALMAGINQAMDQDKATDKLQAQLGASDKVAAQAGHVAGSLYANGISDTFEDATEAIKATMQSGILPPDASEEQLQRISTKAQDVSKVFDQDLGGVTNAVSQMMRTGLAKNADEAFDVITRGFQTGADKAGDLMDTYNEYGVQFKKLGLDGATSMGLMSQAIKGGARSSDLAADALKEFSIRSVDGSKLTSQGFKALGLDGKKMSEQIAKGGKKASDGLALTLEKLKKIKDPVKRSQTAVALFGTQAEDLGDALYAMDPSKAVDTLGKVGGAAKKMGDTVRDNASTRIDVFKRKITEGFVQGLGTYAIPAITKATGYISQQFGPAMHTATRYLGGLFDKAKSGQGAMTPLKTGFSNAMSGVKTAMGSAVGFVKTQFMPWFRDQIPKIKPVITQVAKTVGTVMTTMGDYIKTLVKVAGYLWKKFGGTIKSVASNDFGMAMKIIKGVFKVIQGVFEIFSGILTLNWKKTWQGIKDVISGLKDTIVAAAKGVFDGITTAAKGIVKGMYSIGGDIVHGLANGITDLGGWIAGKVTSFVKDHIPRTIQKVLGINSPSRVTKELGKWAGIGLVVGLTGTYAKVHATAKKVADAIHKAMKGSTGKTKARLQKLSDLVSKDNKKLLGLAKARDKIAARLKAAETKLSDLQKAKSDYAANIKSNILGSAGFLSNDDGSVVSTGSIFDKLKDAAAKAKQFAANLAKLKSKGVATSLIDQIAQQGVDGGSEAAAALASGTPEQIKAINDQQKQLASAATKAGDVASKAMYDNGINAAKGLVNGLKKQKKSIEKVMLDIAKAMEKAIRKALGIKSPSRVMAKIGDFTADGFLGAVQRRIREAGLVGGSFARAVAAGALHEAQGVAKAADKAHALENATAAANASGSDGAYVRHNQWQAAQPIVHVHVAGHVTAERDLAKAIATNVRDEIIRIGKRNGGKTGL
jgi:phage-related minor tail protein